MRAQLIAIIAAVLAVIGSITAVVTQDTTTPKVSPTAQSQFPTTMRVGVWDWIQPDHTTSEQDNTEAATLKQQGVTEVYVDISAYNDYDELTTADRQTKIAGFNHALATEVAALHSQGISAQALVGNKHWSDPDAVYIPLKLLNYAHDYNASVSPGEQLSGIQFDIEFYNDKEVYADNHMQSTQDYLSMVQQLTTLRTHLFGNSNFALGFAVPEVFSGRDTSFVPDVAFNGSTAQPPLVHIAALLKSVPDSYIALMAYRNHATGDDGTIALAAASLHEIQDTGEGKVSVLIGEETTEQTPAKITYFGSDKATLRTAVAQIQQAYQDSTVFKGVAIDDQLGFLRLKD
ncbi:MAG TPA: hypothetical protein VLG92_02835 [Candidatus Saccharimonadia bacterium]|nr:hypothetical protein [Candidatus Saccharimonadia bacterium]